MAITTTGGVIAGALPPLPFFKATQACKGAGTFQSLWRAVGLPPAGAVPPAYTAGSGYVPSSATQGAYPFPNPSNGELSYLARLGASASKVGMLVVYDRVWACSGFDTNTTSLQTITAPVAAGRYSVKAGIEAWLEVYEPPGDTPATWTVKYVNQNNNAGRSATYEHPASSEVVGQMMPLRLQGGDLGVAGVTSFQCSAASGAAGNVGITLMRRLAEIPLTPANAGVALDAFALGLPRLHDNACLAFMLMCGDSDTGDIMGSIVLTQG